MRVLCLTTAVLLVAGAVSACDVDACGSVVGMGCRTMKISVCPLGDFELIERGCGGTVDYLWVQIQDECGRLLAGIPPNDFWFQACDPAQELAVCAGSFVADSATGANGRTTFSGAWRAGGCTLSGGLWIAVMGAPLYAPPCPSTRTLCLDIVIKGPDLTGPPDGHPDGIVNLSDLVPFGFTYNKNLGQAGYNACCDYNDDDQCNLSDFAFFGIHYQHG